MPRPIALVGIVLIFVVSGTGFVLGSGVSSRSSPSTLLLTSTETSVSSVTSIFTSSSAVVSTITETSEMSLLSSEGPIAIFPQSDLPSPCQNSNLSAATYYNSTFYITTISNNTLAGLRYWHTNLTAVYEAVVNSQNFTNAADGRFWITVSWDYYRLNSRYVVQAFFVLPSSTGSVYGYLWPVFYYIDDGSVSVTFTKSGLTFGCPNTG